MKSLLRALEHLSLNSKLLLAVGVGFVITLVVGIASLLAIRTLSESARNAYEHEMLGVSHILEAKASLTMMGRDLRWMAMSVRPTDRAAGKKSVVEAQVRVRQHINEGRRRVSGEEIKAALRAFDEAFPVYAKSVEHVIALLGHNDAFADGEATQYLGGEEYDKAILAADRALDTIVAATQESARRSAEQSTELAIKSQRNSTLLLVIGLCASIGFGLMVTYTIRRPLNDLRQSVEALAAGQLDSAVPYTDQGNEIGAMAKSLCVLQQGALVQKQNNWVNTNKADLLDSMQGIDDMPEFARRLMARLAPLLSAQAGAFYYRDQDDTQYRLIGSHGFRYRKGVIQQFAVGEGLVGQCVLEKTRIELTDADADDMQIVADGMVAEKVFLLAAPLKTDASDIPAVIKFASTRPFGPPEYALIDEVLPLLALGIHVLERNRRTRDLAAILQQQAVEMEAQQVEIKATEAWFRGIIESAPDGMLVADEQGTIILVNPQVESLFGYASGELNGKSIDALVPESIRGNHGGQRDAYMHGAANMTRAMRNRELQGQRKDGSMFPVEVGLARLPDLGGRGICVCATIRDVTERKAAQKAIADSEDRLSAAMQGANLGLWDWQADPDVLVTNDIWSEMLGYTKQELDELYGNTAARWANMVWPEDMDRAVGAFVKYVNGEIPEHRMEIRMKTKSGEPKWVQTVGAAVGRDVSGKVTRMVGIHQDITERKKAEQEVLRAKQIAEDATKTKSDFLANMSHEIRTPMNAIIGMSHLALQTKLDKKQKNYIEKVHRAGENLLGIINDILDFSKIEAGKMTIEQVDFRLEDVLDHLANLVGIKTDDKGLELLFNTAPDVPTALVGDSLRLGQILINLGNNAVKFTETGEVVVNIETVKDAKDLQDGEVELHFWVKDTGIGMTPEQCGKMFQSFSQADASTTRKYGGTGLGLAISKSLVEGMHGRIWVESEAGKGSEFHFHARFGLQKDPMPRRMFRADELLGVRVLVVDDNASAREILATMAKNFGLEVDVANDGKVALKLVAEAGKKQLPYDLILMDWQMPGMDGVETVQQLQDEHLDHTPAVIMVTAYGREEALSAAEQRGVAIKTVLPKPVTPSTLLEAIGEVLGKGDLVETRADEKTESYAESMAALKGARVVLVEDNEMNQELAMELLAQAGIEVVLANNGQEAVDILSKDANFDGVLMDCQMPVMDGYTATREIRKLPQFAKLPIIAMTANAMAGDKEKVIEAGMWDHIAKPLNVADMFATIAKWIKPKQTAATAAAVSPAPTSAAVPAPAPAAAPKPVGGLPPLPGIDVKAGLATCTNKESLYIRMLVKFRDSQGKFAELFAAALQDADPVAPARTAHTLKGTAGNIGAKALQAAAGELEHACNDKAPAKQIAALLKKALAELAVVMPGLAQVGAGETAVAVPAATSIPEAELKAKLDRLKQLLEESDSEAGDLLSDLLDKLGNSPLAKQLKPVAAAIEGFDFDAALEKLNAI